MKSHSPGGIPAVEGEFPQGIALVNLDLTGACAVIYELGKGPGM